ncbi:Tannase/feruloyl esterase [Xylariales sp. PMI_506]|nr:Tannase/feruloyl esterase [Xylariales sp. PMI_506]
MTSITIPASSCVASAIPIPTVFGAEILDVAATLVLNYSGSVSDQYYYNHPSTTFSSIDFCNITVTYTHPGENDTIYVESWLPMNTWNGRLQAVGGGGYVAGRFFLSYTAMAGALADGYATTTTDGGVGSAMTPDSWALASDGNVDLYTLQDFSSVSLNDQAIIAKALITSFYGQGPAYSYWSGCSQGGRQGFMLAQRYPDAYDGIAAAAPAFNWGQFIPQAAWGQVQMSIQNEYPYPCVIDAFTAAAVAFCDPEDGVTDGVISDPDSCAFDPFSLVGTVINCTNTGEDMTITEIAATIINATWTGPRTSDDKFLWYGPYMQSRLTGAATVTSTSDLGYLMTLCSNGTCSGLPTGLGEDWLQYFVKKDPSWNYTLIQTADEFGQLFHASVQQFDSIIGTSDPDLSEFRNHGGKLITYHGLADGLIPTRGTTDYYDRATVETPDIHDFFRYFQVPGLGHCAGDTVNQPTATWQALVNWVENGTAPDTLPIQFNYTAGTEYNRILCPYPAKAVLITNATDVTSAESFECST